MTNKDFKIGDCIKKVFENQCIDNKIFKIIDLKEVKGGDWHDGFSISLIATIESIVSDDDAVNPETEEQEEYCIQYINYMCQINNVYAKQLE